MDLDELQLIANAWAGLVPEDDFTPIIEAAEARTEELNQEHQAVLAAADGAAADVAAKVAAGEMSLTEACEEHARRVAGIENASSRTNHSRVGLLRDLGQKAIIAQAKREIRRGLGEALPMAYDQLAKAESKAQKAGDEAAIADLAARRHSLRYFIEGLSADLTPAPQPAPEPKAAKASPGGVKWAPSAAHGGDLMPTGRA